jgi:hypothetical protein
MLRDTMRELAQSPDTGSTLSNILVDGYIPLLLLTGLVASLARFEQIAAMHA